MFGARVNYFSFAFDFQIFRSDELLVDEIFAFFSLQFGQMEKRFLLIVMQMSEWRNFNGQKEWNNTLLNGSKLVIVKIDDVGPVRGILTGDHTVSCLVQSFPFLAHYYLQRAEMCCW